jgi:hypothetical protein
MYLLLFLALSVKDEGTALRSGCSPDSRVVATLPVGANLKIRFAMSGEAVPCYKVSVESGGQSFDGYLSASSIDGLETFDNSRKSANWIEIPTTPSPSTESAKTAPPTPGLRIQGSPMVLEAERLIKDGRPEDALRLLEPELRAKPDANLFLMAGVAAWKNQDNRLALEYWRKSMELTRNADLEKLYASVDREVKNDSSREKLYGIRVVLRYDDVVVPAETARRMVVLVDDTYARVSAELGCTTKERIPTIVQSREAYFKTTGAAEWSGGLFDGRIHMPADAGQQLDARIQKALTHETVHACLAMLGQWPSWLHEGMAQKLSGAELRPEIRAKLKQLAQSGQIPKLSMLTNGWMGLDTRNATVAYALALDAVELLYENYHSDGVRNLMRNPERLPAITADLEKRLAE